MQTSTRPRPQPQSQPPGQRRQHAPQISISDESHHVTDAISSLYEYGDQQQPTHQQHPGGSHDRLPMMPPQPVGEHRPLSFLPSARDEITHVRPGAQQDADDRRSAMSGKPLSRAKTLEVGIRNHERPQHHTNRNFVVGRSASAPHEPAISPGLRAPADTATSSFPLNDIDYESSPAAVAQELSNLQAIRRMSMNVDVAGDPDLPSFAVPNMTPPGGDTDDEDPSRLFWVPASVHPELAPKEFKTFIDTRMEALKRRSREFSPPVDEMARSTSGGGLSRKKSMLSRQIDNSGGRGADGYQDGAERLERKRSSSSNDLLGAGMSNLHDLEVIVNDPSKAMSPLSVEQNQAETPVEGDMPILPPAPGGSGLRRSTRTTYRRGSLREGKRVPPSKRAAALRTSDQEGDDAPETPTSPQADHAGFGLSRVQTEPLPPVERQQPERTTENFSRPVRRRVVSPPSSSAGASVESVMVQNQQAQEPAGRKSPPTGSAAPSIPPIPQSTLLTSREPKPFVSQFASNGRTTAKVPPMVEHQMSLDIPRAQSQQSYRPPERSSSHEPIAAQYQQPQQQPQQPQQQQQQLQQQPQMPASQPPVRAGKHSPAVRQNQQNDSNQTLQHMAAHPSPLPGNSTRTDSLSFIPTLTEDKKADAKKDSGRKTGWSSLSSWLTSDDKEKQRKKEEEAREAERNRSKLKGVARPGDSTRLDVLQQTMDSTKGRESLVLDRGDIKLEKEREKETSRKFADTKKEKDGLLGKFGGLFGDSKKKPEREAQAKKATRALSPDPPRPALRPDVDYNWTRFSIIEERAIYRMAHIKLANPRRPLYSQVLLSNFMYSYLAKVQQMHPQMQIPQTAAAKAQQRAQQQQQQQQKRDQPEEFYQYQRYQEQLQEQDRAQQAQTHGQGQVQAQHDNAYMDDSQAYEYDQDDEEDDRPQSRAAQHTQHNGMSNGDGNYSHGGGYGYQPQQQQQQHSAYQYQRAQFDEPERAEGDDMW